MPFKPGQSGNPAGKPRGAVAKVNREFRDTVRQLLEDNAENVSRWLSTVADGDGTDKGKPDPARALDLMAKLAEYAAPKLSRTEVTGLDGGPISVAEASSSELDSRIANLEARLKA